MSSDTAFAADAMLGRLSRWLRLLGHDCFYERDVSDERLIEVARAGGRVLLTRDRRVVRKYARSLYLPPGTLDDELFAVHAALQLFPPETPPNTRCPMCNSLLLGAAPADLDAAQLPPRIRGEHPQIWRCPHCARLYWRGSHVASMEERLARLRARLAARAAAAPPVERPGQNG